VVFAKGSNVIWFDISREGIGLNKKDKEYCKMLSWYTKDHDYNYKHKKYEIEHVYNILSKLEDNGFKALWPSFKQVLRILRESRK